MNPNNYANILDIKETAILQNLKRILQMKQINISEVVLVNYIRNNHMSGFIGVEQINKIIQECVTIENNNNKVKDNEPNIQQEIIEDSNINTNEVDEKKEEAPQTIAKSIISNMQSSVPKRELREELIYIKGISGINFTNTFNLNKTYNNVESLELMSGYINDDRTTVEANFWESGTTIHAGGAATGVAVTTSVNILTITTPDTNGDIKVGDKATQDTTNATGIVDVILSSTTFRLRNVTGTWNITNTVSFTRNTGLATSTVPGSIGPVPFLWLDIVEPTIRNYAHYVNYSRSEYAAPSSCDCGLSSCNKCGISGVGFTDCSPGGTFMVTLKQINSLGLDDVDGSANPPANLVYIVDKGEYEKKFNQLISMNKLKINLKNINGRMLWGCEACGLGNQSVKTSNLLRWEFIFKVKYYVNVLENNFLFQN
jgi:hypothetical protein